eukprot:5004456-Amphidinium_carterae.1
MDPPRFRRVFALGNEARKATRFSWNLRSGKRSTKTPWLPGAAIPRTKRGKQKRQNGTLGLETPRKCHVL